MRELFGYKERTAFKVGGIYLVFGCLWILISDKVLHLMMDEESMIEGIQTLKGITFVLLSAVLIFFTVRHEGWRRLQKEEGLREAEERIKEEVVKASEEERNRISSELHDGIQQQLAGISMMVEHCKENGGKEDLDQLKEKVDQCIQEVRSVSHNISSLQVERKGSKAALEELSSSDQWGGRIHVSWDLDVLDHHRLTYFTAINIYRIAQELLLNASKHSSADRIEISIQRYDQDHLLFRYRENAPHQREKSGLGTLSLRKRVESLRGQFISISEDGTDERAFAFTFFDPNLSGSLKSEKSFAMN